MTLPLNQILHGDCISLLASLPAASVDLGALGLDRETQRKILDAMRRNQTDE
jgi:hypothetical protein